MTPVKDLTGKPLFIPLKSEYFDAFKDGSKTDELRLYGKRWNENTCRPGREVVLSRGYGKQQRMRGVIGSFQRIRPAELPPRDMDAMIDCYGSVVAHDIARIGIKIELPEKGG